MVLVENNIKKRKYRYNQRCTHSLCPFQTCICCIYLLFCLNSCLPQSSLLPSPPHSFSLDVNFCGFTVQRSLSLLLDPSLSWSGRQTDRQMDRHRQRVCHPVLRLGLYNTHGLISAWYCLCWASLVSIRHRSNPPVAHIWPWSGIVTAAVWVLETASLPDCRTHQSLLRD